MAVTRLLGVNRVAISGALGLACVLAAPGAGVAAQVEPLMTTAAMKPMDHGAAHDGHAAMPHTLGANGAHDQHQSQAGGHALHEGGDAHAHHRQMMQRQGYERSVHDYAVPDIALLDTDGTPVSLEQLLDTDKPVLLNFIYTTCTTICPVLTATFSQVQHNLGDQAQAVRMISVTIDPDQDTPERMRAYAEKFHAGPQWRFITGERDRIVAVQKAFDVYRGSKTNHEPITLLRASGANTWVRIDGIASAADIIKEYGALASAKTQ